MRAILRPRLILLAGITLLLLLTGIPPPADAQIADTPLPTLRYGVTPAQGQPPLPLGVYFPISSQAGGDAIQGKPVIAADGTNFFVVWRDQRTGERYDIYGARVTHDGAVLDPTGIPISTYPNADPLPGNQYFPSVAFDGTNYLVVWIAHRDPDPNYEVFVARVTPGGTVLDPDGIQITNGAAPLRMPSIAFDGTNYLVAWRMEASQIKGARVTTAGQNLDGPTGFSIGPGFYPYVAFDGVNYMVVWHGWSQIKVGLDIYGARVSPDGVILAPGVFTISAATEDQYYSSIAFDGTNYLVVWHDFRGGNQYNSGTTYGARVSADGVVLDDPAFKIADYTRGQYAPRVMFDGTDYFVVWQVDNSPADFRIVDAYGRRVSKDGIVLDEQAVPIGTSYGHQFGPVIGFDTDRYLVTWSESLSEGRCLLGCIYGQLLQKQIPPQSTPLPHEGSRSSSSSPQGEPNQVDGSWVGEPGPTGSALNAIWGYDDTHVYAVGEEPKLFQFDGVQWTDVAPLTNARKFELLPLGATDEWTVGWCWDVVNWDGQNVNFSGCLDYPPGAAPIGLGIWGTSDTNIHTVGVEGVYFHYDGGPGNEETNWTELPSGVVVDLHDIWGTSADNVYAVGEFGTVIRYDGLVWSQPLSVPTVQSLNGLWGRNANDIFVVGDFGTILHYDGSTWSSQPSVTTEHLMGVWGCAAPDVYAVG